MFKFEHHLIISGLRKIANSFSLTDTETQNLQEYIKRKIAYTIKTPDEDLEQELFAELLKSNEWLTEWLTKNKITLSDLTNEELFKQFDDRTHWLIRNYNTEQYKELPSLDIDPANIPAKEIEEAKASLDEYFNDPHPPKIIQDQARDRQAYRKQKTIAPRGSNWNEIKRLRRIHGSLQGIMKMVTSKKSTGQEISYQLKAVSNALRNVLIMMLNSYSEHYLDKNTFKGSEKLRLKTVERVIKTISNLSNR